MLKQFQLQISGVAELRDGFLHGTIDILGGPHHVYLIELEHPFFGWEQRAMHEENEVFYDQVIEIWRIARTRLGEPHHSSAPHRCRLSSRRRAATLTGSPDRSSVGT
jgi:hypothetical protein